MKATLNNTPVQVATGYFVIESNKGNHSGHNRTWKQLRSEYAVRSGAYGTRAAARRAMAHEANMRNDLRPKQQGYCTLMDDSAWCDGATLAVVNAAELVEMINGTGTNLANIYAITVLEEEVVA